MKKTKIAIIGDGIGAWATIFLLKKEIVRRNLVDQINLLQIASENLAPSCSRTTLATNAIWGTKKGVSELGDLLVNSYELFCNLQNEHQFKSAHKGWMRQYYKDDSVNLDSWERKFKTYSIYRENEFNYYEEEGYFLDPALLKEELTCAFYSHEKIDGFVIAIENKKILTKDSGEFSFDKLILCTSLETKLFSAHYKLVDKRFIKETKPVQGSFIEFNYELDSKSFVYALDEGFLVYKDFLKKLYIGSSSEIDNASYIPNTPRLKELYHNVFQAFNSKIKIPPFEEGKIITGIRHKGIKRKPFFGEIDKDIYALHSLYKNGFLFSFYGADKIVQSIFL